MTCPRKWLLLSAQVPTRPGYLRVKLWRRLRDLGALAMPGGAAVLPDEPAQRAAFEALARDIIADGGQAALFTASLVGAPQALEEQFNAARAGDYAQWIAETEAAIGAQTAAAALARLSRRLQHVEAIDFFQAPGRAPARETLQRLAEASARHPDVGRAGSGASYRAPELHGRVWVTRKDVGIDRIASAWLIANFIDPRARFRFVDPKRYVHQRRELRFDMSDGEFTHEGDRCTFETLVARACPSPSPGLLRLAEIIHQLDIPDGKYDCPEAQPLAVAIDRIRQEHSRDQDRIAGAGEVLDGLLSTFRNSAEFAARRTG